MRTVSLVVGLFLAVGLIPLTGPAPALATSHRGSMEDPPGDTMAFFSPGGEAGLPDSMFSTEVDIVEVFVENETPTDVTIGLRVAGFDPSRDSTRGMVQSPGYDIAFTLSSDPDASWRALSNDCFFGCDDEYMFSYWTLCRSESSDEGNFGSECWGVEWPMRVDFAAGTIKFPLDREALASLGDVESASAGDALTVTSANADGFGFIRDSAGGEGNELAFEFESDTANRLLALGFAGDEYDEGGEGARGQFSYNAVWRPEPSFGVSPGGQVVLPLTVENRFASKKIVDLDLAMTGDDASAFNLTFPEQLVVPGNDRVVANLVVGAKPDVVHRSAVRVAITARPIGEASAVGFASAFVQATVTPSVASNVLHFHSVRQHCVGIGGFDDALYEANPELFACDMGFLNVLDQDPTYADADVPVLGPDNGRNWFFAALDTPLAQDLRFDLEQPVQVDVVMVARHLTPTVRVEANLFVGETHVGGGSHASVLGPNAQALAVTFTPRLERETVSALEGDLYAVLTFDDQSPTSPPFNTFGGVSLAPTTFFRPADSTITLPLLPLTKAAFRVAGGEHLVSLDLKEGKDPEEYVNPGKGLLFNMSLGNQGTTNDTVLLSLNRSTADGWLVTLSQSRKVRLEPGEYANTTVVVRAPAGAEEGERVAFDVVATSTGDPAAKATMRLTVIATKGVAIDDEPFEPQFGPGSKHGGKKKDSPLGGEAALAGALAALLLAGRRRRGAARGE